MNDTVVSGSGQPAERVGTGRRVWLAFAAACYVVAGTVGLVAGAHTVGWVPLLWVLYTAGLLIILGRLSGVETGCSAAIAVVLLTSLAYYIGSGAWDDLVLQARGRSVQAVVIKERVETGSRGDKTWHYGLIRRDGIDVAGPDLESDGDRFHVGQTITVIEDPKGKLAPQTPGETSATGDLLGAGGVVIVCLAVVGWTAYPGARSRKKTPFWTRAADVPVDELEERLREVLRAGEFDRRGYIRVSPGNYRGLTHQRAAQIAREEGLRAEAFGNRGYWRFGEKVVEEVE